MKILISKISHGVGHQILDGWHAYQQHKHSGDNNYSTDIQYEITAGPIKFNKQDYNLSILLLYIDKINLLTQILIADYDLVFICNGGEPLRIANPETQQLLEKNHNVFLIANSFLPQDHVMSDRTVWFPHNIQTCRDYWTRHFYPQYFDLYHYKQLQRNNLFYYINGENRADRQFFIDVCNEMDLDLPTKNTLSTTISEIADSQWESTQDTEFKKFVNNLYPIVLLEDSDNTYYSSLVDVGIDRVFGKITPGYFPLPLYFETSCVIFPESGWQNNELNITEKALKCFYAGSLPFPIAGANVNQLYNEIGFYTAWNLLPKDMQTFDSILDHTLRYQKAAEAIQWLKNNPEVLVSPLFKEMTEVNKIKFLTCDCDYIAIDRFDQLVKKFLH